MKRNLFSLASVGGMALAACADQPPVANDANAAAKMMNEAEIAPEPPPAPAAENEQVEAREPEPGASRRQAAPTRRERPPAPPKAPEPEPPHAGHDMANMSHNQQH